jgi:hypothetical protein
MLPEEAQYTASLGAVRPLWNKLLAALPQCEGHEWKSYSPKVPPSLRLKHGKRVIVYLLPGSGTFRASFALGGRAMEAARAAKLPGLDGAKKYAEGTAIRIDVKTAKDVDLVCRFAAIKLAY